jgi:hypothetical protein
MTIVAIVLIDITGVPTTVAAAVATPGAMTDWGGGNPHAIACVLAHAPSPALMTTTTAGGKIPTWGGMKIVMIILIATAGVPTMAAVVTATATTAATVVAMTDWGGGNPLTIAHVQALCKYVGEFCLMKKALNEIIHTN